VTSGSVPSTSPRLSVVVPVYNVERYLDECLTSLSQQRMADLEVVMIDDGSTDRSAGIAAAWAARDSRFRLVRQLNGGLGHARNTGTRHATGEFLTFVDSDDVVPTYAYDVLLGMLASSGSDFATGNVQRLSAHGVRQSWLHRRTFLTTRSKTHISRDLSLLYDRTAWNKVFRRSFWDFHGLVFPEGVLYEDTPVTLPAHFLAKSVDVTHLHVYRWRERDAGEASITQDRLDPRQVVDRMAGLTTVAAFLEERGLWKAKRRFDAVSLQSDLLLYLNLVDVGDLAYARRVVDVAQQYLRQVDPRVVRELPSRDRLKYHFVARDMIPELTEVVRSGKDPEERLRPVERVGARVYGNYPYRGDPEVGVPDDVYKLGSELRLNTRVEDVAWGPRGQLVLRGSTHIQPLDSSTDQPHRVMVWLVHARTWVCVPLFTRPCEPPAGVVRPPGHAGFRAVLPAIVVRVLGIRPGSGSWRIGVTLRSGKLRRFGRFGPPLSGVAQRPPYRDVSPHMRATPTYASNRSLLLRFVSQRSVLQSCIVQGDDLVVSVDLKGRAAADSVLQLRRIKGAEQRDLPLVPDRAAASPGLATVTVPMQLLLDDVHAGDDPSADERAGDGLGWELYTRLGPAGRSERLSMRPGESEQRFPLGRREVVLHRTRYGNVSLLERSIRPVVVSAAWAPDDDLELCFDFPHDSARPWEVVLSERRRLEQLAFPLTSQGARVAVKLPVSRLVTFAGQVPMRAGDWEISVRPKGQPERSVGAKVGHALLPALPLVRDIRGKRFAFVDWSYDFPMIRVEQALPVSARGQTAQWHLSHEIYPRALQEPLRDAVLFNTFTGRQFSDSPRSIHEELARRGTELDLLWVVRDQQVVLPASAEAVALWSEEWFEAYAQARFIVTNQHLPSWFRRRHGQTVVQTWHGTPLKKIGLDIDTIAFKDVRYKEKLRQEVPNWTHLVSPNPFSSSIMRGAFGFDGQLLETGYPRNDVLLSPEGPDISRRVRDLLGIPRDKRAVLYAPTWRDNQSHSSGGYRLDFRIDVRAAQQALGEDHVLLVRRHPNIVDGVPGAGDGFVYDVSDYPDVNHLLLLSDVLVTDYSSLMFDYAVLRRPMLFFTYDLETYRDKLRGFYFNFEDKAPGPLLATSEELVAALRDVERFRLPFAGRYQDFMSAFCAWDDGKASARVVDEVFGSS